MDLRPVWYPSPNYTEGRGAFKPEAIVIHLIDGSLSACRSWFKNPASKVSAHYGIGQDGSCDQYVDETDTAWANGRKDNPTWTGLKPTGNPNSYTLSIEHEGKPGDPWSEAMRRRSAMLIAEMHVRWLIPLDEDHVIRHAAIYSLKPFCPGPQALVMDLISRAKARL